MCASGKRTRDVESRPRPLSVPTLPRPPAGLGCPRRSTSPLSLPDEIRVRGDALILDLDPEGWCTSQRVCWERFPVVTSALWECWVVVWDPPSESTRGGPCLSV